MAVDSSVGLGAGRGTSTAPAVLADDMSIAVSRWRRLTTTSVVKCEGSHPHLLCVVVASACLA